MKRQQYVALLRGINVGGKNLIRMTDLKSCFEAAGYYDVVTFIQSGNVLFTAGETDLTHLTEQIEAVLSDRFGLEQARVVVVSHKMLGQILKQAPKGFGTEPENYRYDVMFCRKPLSPKEALKSISLNPEVDQGAHGTHALYFSRLIAKSAQSRLAKVVQVPFYREITVRNWNTTSKLLALMDARADSLA